MFGIRYRKANPTDYVLHFSKDAPVASPTLGFKLTARF